MVFGQPHPFHTFNRASVGTGTFYPLGISVNAAVFAATMIDSLAWRSYTGLVWSGYSGWGVYISGYYSGGSPGVYVWSGWPDSGVGHADSGVYVLSGASGATWIPYDEEDVWFSGYSGSGEYVWGRCTGTGQTGCATCLKTGSEFYRTVSHASDDNYFPYVHDTGSGTPVGVRYRLPYYPFFNRETLDSGNICIDFGRAVMLEGLVYPYISIQIGTGEAAISSVMFTSGSGSNSGTASITIMDWGTVQMFYVSPSGTGNIISTGDIWLEKNYYSLTPSSYSAAPGDTITITSPAGSVNLAAVEKAYFGDVLLNITSKDTGSISLNGFKEGREPIRLLDKRLVRYNRYLPPFEITVRS